MIQTYKRKPILADSYDTIVIGSGMGGLTTAAIPKKNIIKKVMQQTN